MAYNVLFFRKNSEGKTVQTLSAFFEIKPGITALIGGGGKTSTMYALAEELHKKGSVIVCTSTHILCPPQYPFLPRLLNKLAFGEVVSTGSKDGHKLSTPEQSFDELTKLADYVLVEADGSRQLPLKAHASHEPAIPKESSKVLTVIGIDGLGKPIREVAHRPELYASAVHADIDDTVTAGMIRDIVAAYPQCDGIIINKADDPDRIEHAMQLAALFDVPVAVTALQSNDPIKAYWREKP